MPPKRKTAPKKGRKAKSTTTSTPGPTPGSTSTPGPTTSSTAAPPAKRARKSGDERAYPQAVLKALKEGTPLYANRRGVVPVQSESEKPVITVDELYKNRRLGLSFKSIGKKLGIECSKEEVVRVYDILRENAPNNLPDIQTIPISAKRQLPSPLWYCFRSELDEIADHALPGKTDMLSSGPHVRVLERLGDDSAWMLQTYLTVGKLIQEEVHASFQSARWGSKLSEMEEWTSNLPSKLLSQSFSIAHGVAEASFQMTKEWRPGEGRCQCGSSKRLRFTWKNAPIGHPSFFWGCVNYNRGDQARHDRAKPCTGTLCACLTAYFPLITTGDLVILKDRVEDLTKEWSEKPDLTEDDYRNTTKLYGGNNHDLPHTTKENILAVLRMVVSDISNIVDQRSDLCPEPSNRD